MSRVQLALNVDDLDEAITFYSKLFNTEPAKVKRGYANFAITEPPLKLVLLENPGHGGTLNHLGVEVQSSDTVHAEITRLTEAFLHNPIRVEVSRPASTVANTVSNVAATLPPPLVATTALIRALPSR